MSVPKILHPSLPAPENVPRSPSPDCKPPARSNSPRSRSAAAALFPPFDQSRNKNLPQHLKRPQIAKEARLIDRHRLRNRAMQMSRPPRLQHIDKISKAVRARQPRNRCQSRIEQSIARRINQVRRLLQHQLAKISVVRYQSRPSVISRCGTVVDAA